jgi:hypothetical protein
MGQDIPVALKTHWPHILQSNSSPLTARSVAATGRSSRAYPSRFHSGCNLQITASKPR